VCVPALPTSRFKALLARVSRVLACLLACAFAAGAFAAGPDPAHVGRTFTEVTTPDFVLIAPEGEPRARALALRIVTFRRALESLLGAPLRSTTATTIFALGSEDWTRYAQPRPGMAGYFAAQPFATDLMFDASMPGQQPLELMLHEYTHHLLRTLGPLGLPPFVDEGLAEVLGTARFSARAVRFPVRADHLALLRASPWLPFEDLVEVRRRDPHYLEPARARLFYAQAWATMFYVLAAEAGGAPRRLPEYLEGLRGGRERAETAVERLVGRPTADANEAISRFVLARVPPADWVIRLPAEAGPAGMTVRRIGSDEYGVRLGELLLRLGNRGTLARALFRAVPAHSPFAARAQVGAALAVLQSGDLQFAAVLLDDPALARELEPGTAVQLARGLLQLSLPGAELQSETEALRVQRLARARDLFAAALAAPCCWLEATHGHVLSMLALQRPSPELLDEALRALAAAPSNPELAVAVALVHETEGRAAEAQPYWAAAARSLQQGPARTRVLQRLNRDPDTEGTLPSE
jgi:hypothetical protein